MLSFILLFLCIVIVSTILTLHDCYPYYKKTYLAIKNREYVRYVSPYFNSDSLTYFRKANKSLDFYNSFDDEIILFENGSIKLLGNLKYIHTALYTYFDPYTLYWFYKIRRALNESMKQPILQKTEKNYSPSNLPNHDEN